MTVIDTSAVIDYLIADEAADAVEELFSREGTLSAPDLLVFEVLAVFRRDVFRGLLSGDRAQGAVSDLGDLAIDLFPSMDLRSRAWELRHNLTTADALFLALAELLDEPFATKDRHLIKAAKKHTKVETLDLCG